MFKNSEQKPHYCRTFSTKTTTTEAILMNLQENILFRIDKMHPNKQPQGKTTSANIHHKDNEYEFKKKLLTFWTPPGTTGQQN